MDTITIGDEVYVIMPRSEYTEMSLKFIDDGKDMERISRARIDSAVLGVLKFYANDRNYLALYSVPDVSNVEGSENGRGLMQCDLAEVFGDCGKKARDVIELLEE